MKQSKEKVDIVNVHFKIHIRANGDIAMMRISQNTNEITLTKEQAISLAREITRKYGPHGEG
jgi:hypothetical protein